LIYHGRVIQPPIWVGLNCRHAKRQLQFADRLLTVESREEKCGLGQEQMDLLSTPEERTICIQKRSSADLPFTQCIDMVESIYGWSCLFT
jgi:hypothetical protein